MTQQDWDNPGTRCFGMLMDGRAQATGIRRPASDATLLWVLNAHHEAVPFVLPRVAGGRRWAIVFDTATHERAREHSRRTGETLEVACRSTQLLTLHA